MFFFLIQRERKEKNDVLLKNVEMSQNEERLKQQLRDESHEISELNETIQQLTDQRNELETRINNCHQQIEGIDELKNEISEKNKVNFFLIIFFFLSFISTVKFSLFRQ